MSDRQPSSLLQSFYQSHHETGRRLSRSIMEKERGALFSGWVGKGSRVLDLGGRDGQLTRYFVEGNEVTIGDIDVAALAVAREKYGVETRPINLNERLPFGDAEFDVVVLGEVLEHCPYPHITLGEIKRVLKPGGRFIGNVPLAYHLKDRWKIIRGKKLEIAADPTHVRFFTYDELMALLRQYYAVDAVAMLKGGAKARILPRFFARNVAFSCHKASEPEATP